VRCELNGKIFLKMNTSQQDNDCKYKERLRICGHECRILKIPVSGD
jgi:hypothetical protein